MIATVLFNHRGIRKLITYLTTKRQATELFAPTANYIYFHKRLFGASTIVHKISLTTIVTPSEDTASSSEEEQNALIKRKYVEYA